MKSAEGQPGERSPSENAETSGFYDRGTQSGNRFQGHAVQGGAQGKVVLDEIIDQLAEFFLPLDLVPQPIPQNQLRFFIPENLAFIRKDTRIGQPKFFGEPSLAFEQFRKAG
jgi:hypothetical protein